MTSPPAPALTEAEQAAFLQSIARVRSAAGRALPAAQANAVQGAAAHGTGTGTGVIATGQAPNRTESAAQAAVDFIAQLHQGLDTVAKQARANGPQPACQAGCAHCCHLRVEATNPEVLHIVQHLRTLPSADQATTLRRLQQHVAAASAGTTRQPCSFLVHDRCAIYSVRPAACRKAHSLSAAHCAEQSPTIPQNLRLLVDAEALMAPARPWPTATSPCLPAPTNSTPPCWQPWATLRSTHPALCCAGTGVTEARWPCPPHCRKSPRALMSVKTHRNQPPTMQPAQQPPDRAAELLDEPPPHA